MSILDELTLDDIDTSLQQNFDKQIKPDDKVEEVVNTTDEKEVLKNNDKAEDVDGVPVSEEENNESNDDSVLTPYAAALKETGILPDFDEEAFKKAAPELKTKMLLDAQQDAINNRAEELLSGYLDKLPPKFKDAFEKFNNGLDPETSFKIAGDLDRLKNIDSSSLSENDELAKQILLEHKMSLGLSKEDSLDEISEMVTYDKAAKKALSNLIKSTEDKEQKLVQQIKLQEEANKKAQQENLVKLKQHIDTVPELIQGLPLERGLRSKVYDVVTKVIESIDGQNYNAIGKWMKDNPMDAQLKLGYIWELTNGFKDFNKISNSAKKSAVFQLEKNLASNEYKNRSAGTSTSINNKNGDAEGLKNFLINTSIEDILK